MHLACTLSLTQVPSAKMAERFMTYTAAKPTGDDEDVMASYFASHHVIHLFMYSHWGWRFSGIAVFAFTGGPNTLEILLFSNLLWIYVVTPHHPSYFCGFRQIPANFTLLNLWKSIKHLKILVFRFIKMSLDSVLKLGNCSKNKLKTAVDTHCLTFPGYTKH